ncbi:LuxR C-terminal-related transcriptional regulator [Planktotalea sp.]|uniref:LuxR C-terminal-related transcriptional regulator n=1 Tax=Planktotalea sp. TaxID=2029877 RepID=UPI0032981EE0
MQRHEPSQPEDDHKLILERIYDIALEPTQLDEFINLWADTDWEEQFTQTGDNQTGAFDAHFKAHLERAEAFLLLGDTPPTQLEDHLKPYDKFAAFTVNAALIVEGANAGANAAFNVSKGDNLSSLQIPSDVQEPLLNVVKDVLHRNDCSERLIKSENETKQGAMLFRVIRIPTQNGATPSALVVSTYVHWREAIGDILNNAFKLTKAEQGVVRKLTEGHDVKSIAASRGTTVGTVREQIKSIIAKMNLRSQADVVRFALILSEFSEPSAVGGGDETVKTLVTSEDWFQAQVWKPFKSIKLPDERVMTYHEMGPSNGQPVLYSHMGSAMVRWTKPMIKLAFQHKLRIICPIRSGYGESDNLNADADVLDTTSSDTAFLLKSLGISKLPYAVHGSDFPFAADLAAKHPELISEVIGIGARPCLPGGEPVDGPGRWQRFFVWTARHNPSLVHFASKAVMMMAKRIGPDAMLNKICRDSPTDLALLQSDEIKQVLVANLELMAGPSSNAARAFAMEYIAFHEDWSHLMQGLRQIPVHIYTAEEDPTISFAALDELHKAYPWITFEVVSNAGLALMYEDAERLIPALADAAHRAASDSSPTVAVRRRADA